MVEEPKDDGRIAPAPRKADAAGGPIGVDKEGSAVETSPACAKRGPLSAGQKAGAGIAAALSVALIAVSAYFVAAPAPGASGPSDLLATTQEAQPVEAPGDVDGDAPSEVEERADAAVEDGEAAAPATAAPSGDAPAVLGGPSSAAGSSDAAGQSSADRPATVTVSVTVDSSAVGSPVSGGTTATFAQGATAYDALMACGLSVNASQSPLGIYVSAIGGLAEGHRGGSDGWKYYVNGADPSYSCGNYVLQDGDAVLWRYALSASE